MLNDPVRIEEIFAEARAKADASARAAYLHEACGSDTQLRQRVEELLAADDDPANLLGVPAATALLNPHVSLSERPGSTIGRYKLLEQIGEGGFGVVFMAEQESPVRRRVALKIIKLGMDTREVIARFEAERQALAMMDHPNIARVFDAGATDTGRPFFVMELVNGISITQYCDRQRLSTRERLSLFVSVCGAVQHAHQKGVIHRDLKPSNVLVAMHDDKPVAKVIDFGVAKATQSKLTERTLFTGFRQMIGTPAYMSPEQTQMGGIDVDTRSDIYSLGVLLYELMTGTTPFESKQLMEAAYGEMQRIIREDEPQQPSTRLSSLAAGTQVVTAQARQSDPKRLTQQMRGDLDWIVMRCLEKDRTRRYETANALSEDLQRHLGDQPVQARRPTPAYRMKKFIRRNKLVFGATMAVTAALIIGLGVSTWLFLRERDARARAVAAEQIQIRLRRQAQDEQKKAQSEAAKSFQVKEFLRAMLDGVGPSVARGRDTTLLKEILDKTAQRVGKDLQHQPEVAGELLTIIGNAYRAIGKAADAEIIHRQGMVIYRQLYGVESPDVAYLLDALAGEISDQGRQFEAEPLERQSLAMRRKLLGDSAVVADSLGGLTLILARQCQVAAPDVAKQQKLAEAETLAREALAIRRKFAGVNAMAVAQSIDNLAAVMQVQGEWRKAEDLQRESLALRRQELGDDDLAVAASLIGLADTLSEQGRYAEAVTLARQSLTLRRKFCGNDHPDVAFALGHLGVMLRRDAKLTEAEEAAREAVAIYRKSPGALHPYQSGALSVLGEVLRDEGKLAEAEGAFREALALEKEMALQKKSNGNGYQKTAGMLGGLLDVLESEGKPAEEQSLLDEILKESPGDRGTWNVVGELSAVHGDWSAAIEPFSRAAPRDRLINDWAITNLAVAMLHCGRIDEYRLYSHELLDRAEAKHDTTYTEKVVWTCLLAPLPPPDQQRVLRLSLEVKDAPGCWGAYAKSLRQFRGGDFDAAVASTTVQLTDQTTHPVCRIYEHFLQSAAYASLGKMDEAKAALARGEKLAPKAGSEFRDNWTWRDWASIPLRHDEAAALISRHSPATRPQ